MFTNPHYNVYNQPGLSTPFPYLIESIPGKPDIKKKSTNIK